MKVVKFIIMLCLLMSLSGCWGSRETDEIVYVMAIGIDAGPNENLLYTFQIANPRAIAGITGAGQGAGGGGGERPLINDSIVAKVPIGAFNLLNIKYSREQSLLHTNAFVISEEVARKGLSKFLNPFNRFRETRGNAFIFICRGKAKDFIEKSQPLLEVSPSKQYELREITSKVHGLTPVMQIWQFYQHSKSKSINPIAPLVGIGKVKLNEGKKTDPARLGDYLAGQLPSEREEPQFIGGAVFKGDKMVGTITGDEVRYLNILRGNLDRSYLVVPDPVKKGEAVGINLSQAISPRIKVDLNGDNPRIKVNVYIEAEIFGIASGEIYETPDKKAVLEKAVRNLIKEGCERIIKRSQEEFRSDIFGFGRYAKMKFLTQDQWQKYNWTEAYNQSNVAITVNVKIRRTGLMLKTSSFKG